MVRYVVTLREVFDMGSTDHVWVLDDPREAFEKYSDLITKTLRELKIFNIHCESEEMSRSHVLVALYKNGMRRVDEDDVDSAVCIRIDVGDPDTCTRWDRIICIAEVYV